MSQTPILDAVRKRVQETRSKVQARVQAFRARVLGQSRQTNLVKLPIVQRARSKIQEVRKKVASRIEAKVAPPPKPAPPPSPAPSAQAPPPPPPRKGRIL